MDRYLWLVSVAAGCSGTPLAPDSCLDVAEWQVPFDHGGRDASAIALSATDGIYVAIGDAGTDVHLGDRTLNGAYLAHISGSGEILAVAPAPEGDTFTGPFRPLTDAADNLYVAWVAPGWTVMASYTPSLELRWKKSIAGARAYWLDVSPAGATALLTQTQQSTQQTLWYLRPDGQEQLSVPVDFEMPNGVEIANADYLYTWSWDGTSSLRTTRDTLTGTEFSALAFASAPSVLHREGGYVGSDGLRVASVQSSSNEVWAREFDANIGIPLETPRGDVLLPATTNPNEVLPYLFVLLDRRDGHTLAALPRCSHTIAWVADEDSYYGIGDGGDHPGSIARFPIHSSW